MHGDCLVSSLKDSISSSGFLIIDNVNSIDDVLDITQSLGEIRTLNKKDIQIIQPSTKEKSKSKSFSYFYGFEDFPLHSDTVFWEQPARYIIFYMQEKSSTSTIILDRNEVKRILNIFFDKKPIFLKKKETGISYSFPLFGNSNEYICYDPCYMKPINDDAKLFVQELENSVSKAVPIQWIGNRLVIIDNWYVLHGRKAVDSADFDRKLFRFYRA